MGTEDRMLDEEIVNAAIQKMKETIDELASIMHDANCLSFGNAGSHLSEGQGAQSMKSVNTYVACGILALIGVISNTREFLGELVLEYRDADEAGL